MKIDFFDLILFGLLIIFSITSWFMVLKPMKDFFG